MSNDLTTFSPTQTFDQMEVEFDHGQGTVWCHMTPNPRPCFNAALLQEVIGLKHVIHRAGLDSQALMERPHFVVFGSRIPGVFNLGGDLNLFRTLIEQHDRAGLETYARACIDASYAVSSGWDLPLTTISLVQGTALGGGMEGALAANVVVAERGVQMGLPEVLFNLFPGMGAFSFLSRRVGPNEAERLILSGKIWHSEELHELGLIDVLAEPGYGRTVVRDYIAQRRRRSPNAMLAMQRVRKAVNPVSYDELEEIAMIWVDAALQLTRRDLRVMERLINSQNRLGSETELAKAV